MQAQQRLMKEKEMKTHEAWRDSGRRGSCWAHSTGSGSSWWFPPSGNINCGKTTLIKALTGDSAMQPRDQLFAKPYITAHAGALPSLMTIIYMGHWLPVPPAP